MSLIPIEPFIDPSIKNLTQKSIDKLSSLLIALRRIRNSWMNYFEDFVSFLKKVEKQDPELYIYRSYIKFLKDKLNAEPHERLYKFLESKGFGEEELSNILLNKTYDEGAFINRLPKTNAWYLWLCIFYLYEPRLSQKFFWDKLEYTAHDEKELLLNYRSLPFEMQDSISKSLQKLAETNSKNNSNKG